MTKRFTYLLFALVAALALAISACGPNACEQEMLNRDFSPVGKSFSYTIDMSDAQDGSYIEHGVITVNDDGTATDRVAEDPEWVYTFEVSLRIDTEEGKVRVNPACGQLWTK